jgi:hypothetical protein
VTNLMQTRGWAPRTGFLLTTAALTLGIFLISSSQAQTLTVLYSFTGGADGANPQAGLIRDSAGNLYGTTVAGGIWRGQPGGRSRVQVRLE